ncbi:hypothetical protein [Flavobacterium sp.]|uniref:hypothetical protein n=1 Tax=Flavobacterium sp. TaxID=239 RepID=UPI002FD907AB
MKSNRVTKFQFLKIVFSPDGSGTEVERTAGTWIIAMRKRLANKKIPTGLLGFGI